MQVHATLVFKHMTCKSFTSFFLVEKFNIPPSTTLKEGRLTGQSLSLATTSIEVHHIVKKELVVNGESLRVCFFLCFLEVFFWRQVAKTSRKQKKEKKHRLGDYMRANISPHCLFFESFWFSRRFLFLTKSGKNLEKTKKNKKQPKIRRLWGQTFPYFFLGGFCYFWSKT